MLRSMLYAWRPAVVAVAALLALAAAPAGGQAAGLAGYPPDFYYSPAYTTTAPGYGLPADGTYPSTPPRAPATRAPEPLGGPAAVTVRVPASARVWFDDSPTTQAGEERRYVTPNLPPDRGYAYDVRARWMDNGKVVDETRHITVRANGVTAVDFIRPDSAGLTSK